MHIEDELAEIMTIGEHEYEEIVEEYEEEILVQEEVPELPLADCNIQSRHTRPRLTLPRSGPTHVATRLNFRPRFTQND
jgi:hypothetical protein